MNSDHRRLLRDLRKRGFEVSGGGSRHYKVRNPKGGPFVVMAASPSCSRSHANALSQLKKIGYRP